jgi:hypothetical protein
MGNCSRARGNQAHLFLAVTNGPIARARADYVNLLEQCALVPVQADLCDLARAVKVHHVDLFDVSQCCEDVHTTLYHWKRHSPACNKIVVQARQVGTAAVLKVDGCLNIQTQAAAALNGAHYFLALLLELLFLDRQVPEDCCRILDAGEGSNVMKRSIVSQRACGRVG